MVDENCKCRNIITMDKLVSSLSEFMGLTRFKVSENFNKNGINIYEVFNLRGEIFKEKDGQAYIFNDLYNDISKQPYIVMNFFTDEKIKEVIEGWNDNWYGVIEFYDGTITIERCR
jgi:hypothetical protein